MAFGAASSVSRPRHVVFVFLDGVGLGAREGNPFLSARMPFLDGLLGGQRPAAECPCIRTEYAAAFPVDACLGVPGRPQSATGQAALTTGLNVPALLGKHYGPWPNDAVRDAVDRGSVFTDLKEAGLSVGSANAYPPRFFAEIESGRRLLSAIPYSLRAAGIPLGTLETYQRRQAISGNISGRDWPQRTGMSQLPVYSENEAGSIVGRMASRHALLFFEHWATDVFGHRCQFEKAAGHFGRLDSFLKGLTDAVDLTRTLILVGSDHGNVEDCLHGRHTENPALGIAWGAGFEAVACGVRDLTGWRPAIRNLLPPSN